MSASVIYQNPRADMVRFLPSGAKTVLDVGCSTGAFGASLRESDASLRLWGVEPDPVAAEAAAQAGFERVVAGSFPEAADRLEGLRFDVIFFNDVLEHMVDPEPALVAAHALLNPGGRVIASIPNVRHFSVWWPLIRKGQWDYEESGILDRTHLRFFTPSSMTALFEATGWRVLDLEGTNRARWPLAGVDTWKTRFLSRASLGRTDPFFWTQYVVTAAPAE